MATSAAYPKEIDGSLLKQTSPIVSVRGYLFSYDRAFLAGEFGLVVGIRTLQRANSLTKRMTVKVQEEEIELLTNLSHRNIVQVFGIVHTSLVDSIRLITELPAFGVMEGFLNNCRGTYSTLFTLIENISTFVNKHLSKPTSF